jgi:hypothetical protein
MVTTVYERESCYAAAPLRKLDCCKRKSKDKPTLDYNSLQNPEIRRQFTLSLTKLKNLNSLHPDVDEQVTTCTITEELEDQAEKVLPKKRPTCQNLPWRNYSNLHELKELRGKLKYSTNKRRFRVLSKQIKNWKSSFIGTR